MPELKSSRILIPNCDGNSSTLCTFQGIAGWWSPQPYLQDDHCEVLALRAADLAHACVVSGDMFE